MLLVNILLALAWAALTGDFSPSNLVSGFGLGYLLLWLGQSHLEPSNYFLKARRVTGFFFYFLWQLMLANLRVTYDVLTFRHHMRPGVLAIPLDIESDAGITLLANVLTLTPGSLSLDVSEDRKTLYVHVMYMTDEEQTRREIKEGFERRIREMLD
ncbi:MAG: Na+/H+ antiporter subunit E [Acidobacteria bacterium]|nr:Na+/H+ antiporter subunit E [Acidobacteriota bacterium]MCW5968939.1 Na+/H+ antiporter subunit E [Blastocatellales bacterium]